MKSLFIMVSIMSLLLCSCACHFYNRSSVTSYQNSATTDGKIDIKTNDSHSVAGDKEKALSTAVSTEGTASASKANVAKTDEKKTENAEVKEQ